MQCSARPVLSCCAAPRCTGGCPLAAAVSVASVLLDLHGGLPPVDDRCTSRPTSQGRNAGAGHAHNNQPTQVAKLGGDGACEHVFVKPPAASHRTARYHALVMNAEQSSRGAGDSAPDGHARSRGVGKGGSHMVSIWSYRPSSVGMVPVRLWMGRYLPPRAPPSASVQCEKRPIQSGHSRLILSTECLGPAAPCACADKSRGGRRGGTLTASSC